MTSPLLSPTLTPSTRVATPVASAAGAAPPPAPLPGAASPGLPTSTAGTGTTTSATAAPIGDPHSTTKETAVTAAVIGLIGALLVALILACWNVVLARRKTREEERSRQRTAFAEAMRCAVQYKEMPYATRRRDGGQEASERVRLSEIVRQIQAELSYHASWIRSESGAVATAYDALVAETRSVAGSAMREAWLAPPISTDAEMNIGPGLVDVRGLKRFEDAYTSAVEKHLLELTPWWCR